MANPAMAMGSSQSLVARLNPPGDPEESLSLGPASNKQQREIGSLAMLRFALNYTTISHRFCREIDVPHREPRWPMEKWTIDVACRAEHFGPGAKGLPKGLTTRDRRPELGKANCLTAHLGLHISRHAEMKSLQYLGAGNSEHIMTYSSIKGIQGWYPDSCLYSGIIL